MTFVDVAALANEPQRIGQVDARFVTFTGPASYSTGGVAVTAATFGLSVIVAVVPLGSVAGKVAQWDAAGSKVMILSGALAEVANASDQSGAHLPLLVLGY